MSKQRLTIVAINVRKGTSQKTQRPYVMYEAQCITEEEKDGETKVVVGVINLSEKVAEQASPGDFLAEFALGQGMGQDAGKLVPRIVSLVPHGNVRPQPKADAKAA